MAMAWFNPTKPATGDSRSPSDIRAQFNSLHEGDFACLRPRAQTSPDMTVYVEPSTVESYYKQLYFNDLAPMSFAGGNSPALTAPTTYPRIDLLCIDSAGTLSWVTGGEDVSPTAPSCPVNKFPICYVYCRTTMTTIVNYEDRLSYLTQGYIYSDVRAFYKARQTGEPTVFIAASNANDLSKKLADYVCDGTSDEVEFGYAVLALSTTGGRIVLSEGTFSVTGVTTLTYAVPIEIVGVRGATTINTTLGDGSGSYYGFYAIAATSVTIRNIKFIVAGTSSNFPAIRVGTASATILVEGCTFTLTGAGINTGLVYITSNTSNGITIKDNLFSISVGSNNTYAIFVIPSSSASNVFIENNIISCVSGGTTFAGIYSNSAKTVVSRNRISGHKYAIQLASGAARSVVTGNTLSDAGIGVYTQAEKCSICGNTITACSDGISIAAVGNIVSENVVDTNLNDGVYIAASSTGTILTSNYIVSNVRAGVYAVTSTGCQISHNIVNSNGASDTASGIYLDGCDYAIIVGNHAFSNGKYGINVSNAGCDKCLVVKNICLSNVAGQIRDAGTGTVLVASTVNDNVVA